MKTQLLLLLLVKSAFSCFAQKKLLVHDLKTGATDTVFYQPIDSSITAAKTDFHIGEYDDEIELLPEVEPTFNLFPDSRISLWKRASDDFDVTKFPLRTHAKMIAVEEGVFEVNCSGNMVSPRHLLTSAQCLFDNSFDMHNVPQYDSLLVCPGFDNGMPHPDFRCSYAKKYLAFDNWSFDGEDLALVELEEPLGTQTGWLGIGFNNDDGFFTDRLFHKFSYPTRFGFPAPPVPYNADTLYHTYGKLDAPVTHFIWASHRPAMVGEEGSSLFYVKNEEEYSAYGTLSYLSAGLHSRFDNWEFAAFQKVIENETTGVSEKTISPTIFVFPNPTTGSFLIKTDERLQEVVLLNSHGMRMRTIPGFELDRRIDISDLPSGMYFLNCRLEGGFFVKKIIKL